MSERSVLSIQIPSRALRLAVALGTAALSFSPCCHAQAASSTDAVETRTSEVGQKIEEAGKAAKTQLEILWQRVEERRLKNRTRDELVAWALMGLLVGGLLSQFGRRGPLAGVLLGLTGAFIGGMVAHVCQLDLGLGPIIITPEDLLCSLAGGVLVLLVMRWLRPVKMVKPL